MALAKEIGSIGLGVTVVEPGASGLTSESMKQSNTAFFASLTLRADAARY